MAGINFYAPVPRVRSESLPACPRPRDNGESLVRIDGLDARIRYAASYRAAGIACAPQGCWVREGVVPLLQQALGLLPEDYSLLIFDAYRPLAVQQALYEEYSALVRRSHPEYTPEQLAAAARGVERQQASRAYKEGKRTISQQMQDAAKQAEADRGQSAPKKNAPDRGDR